MQAMGEEGKDEAYPKGTDEQVIGARYQPRVLCS
jgi:hypothetical protein